MPQFKFEIKLKLEAAAVGGKLSPLSASINLNPSNLIQTLISEVTTRHSYLVPPESGRRSVGCRGVRRRRASSAVVIVRHANAVLRAAGAAAAEEAEQRGRRRGEGVENGGGAAAEKYKNQVNSIDGATYQSLLPQPGEWQLGLIKWVGCLKGGDL